MIALVWGALQSKLAGPIATAVAVALACFLMAVGLQNLGLKGQVRKLTGERNEAVANFTRCQSNRVTLEAAVASQNARVKAWQDEAVNRSREAEAAMQRARAGAVEANRRAEAIRGMVAADRCGDDLILRSVK